jgi:hypothetical protein
MARNLANWVKGYLEYTDHMEAPMSYRMWSAISTIAGALRGKTWFEMGYWTWKPNFYIVFVAPPGIATKSTAFGVGSKMLAAIEGVNLGPDSLTWQAMTEYMAGNIDEVLIDGEYVPMSNVTFSISELGTFLDPTNNEMVDVLVDLWDGRDAAKPWTRMTKSHGTEVIPSPFINFIAGTTPGWIQERMTEYTIGGGMASRTVFVYADKKERLVAYPFLHMNGENSDLRKKLADDLYEISQLIGPFKASAQALEWGVAWYEKHWNTDVLECTNERLSGYMARKQTHLHKIAMVLSAAQRNDMIITKSDFETASRILLKAEQDMSKSFTLVSSQNENAQLQTRVLQTIMEEDNEIEAGLLYTKKLMQHMGFQDYNKAVSGLVASGLVKRTESANKIFLRSTQKKAAAIAQTNPLL